MTDELPAGHNKYEYKACQILLGGPFELDRLGSEGWDVICAEFEQHGMYLRIFAKRRAPHDDDDDAVAWCGECGAMMTSVRPGKWQCDFCEERAAGQADTKRLDWLALRVDEALYYYIANHAPSREPHDIRSLIDIAMKESTSD